MNEPLEGYIKVITVVATGSRAFGSFIYRDREMAERVMDDSVQSFARSGLEGYTHEVVKVREVVDE